MLFDPYTPAAFFSFSTSPVLASQMSEPLGAAAKTAAEEAFEREKAAITCYEEGWDRWDGPIWPIGYVQCRMRESTLFSFLFFSFSSSGV